MKALAVVGVIIPMAAHGFGCPAPDGAPVWQMAACELAANSPHLGAQATQQLQAFGTDAGPDLLPIATFWSLNGSSRLSIVEWGDFYGDLGRELVIQARQHSSFPLSPDEADAVSLAVEHIPDAGPGQQDLLLDAMGPFLARRGLAAVVLHMNGLDFGIAIVPEAYACRWDRVAFAPGFGWTRWTGSAEFDDFPDTGAWAVAPNHCAEAVS